MKILKRGIRNLLVVIVLLLNIGCDQISKNAARNNIEYGERISVISNYLTLTKVENSGTFLSLGKNLPNALKIPLLTVIPTLILIGALVFILKKKKIDLNYALPIAFIIGGGIGNIYDRIRYGSVTDFLHMNFQLFQTGIFNMADVSIMAGTFWLLIIQLNTKMGKQIESY